MYKPVEEQNVRLTRDLSAVYPRFITGTASALRCWLLTSVPTPICLCKPFSCKACPGNPEARTSEILCTCRIQNPDIPRAGRVGAPGGATGRGRARLGADRTSRPGNKGPLYLPRHRLNVASTSFQKHEQAKSYVKPTEEQNQRLTRG